MTEFEEATGPTTAESESALVQQALQRFKLAQEAESFNRTEGLYDLKFSAATTGSTGGSAQWPADILSQRGLDGRPCITTNRINQFLRQVNNDELENRPAAQVNPVGDQGDPMVASIMTGMFRHIEDDSVMEQVVSRKFDGMLRKGWAWYRVLTEYESPDSFDQKIVVRDIPNDFTVYDDPSAQLPDRSDANWRLIAEDIPVGEYKDLYGDVPFGGTSQMLSIGDLTTSWKSGQSVRIAEYYYFETKDEKLFKLVNGKGKFESDLNGTEAFDLDDNNEPISRMSERRQLKWCKINCERILEGPIDVPCQWIPVIFMSGEEFNIDGERIMCGMVRYARDPQRLYNYWNSAMTEAIALAPKAPFVIAAGQVEGFEQYWDTANRRNWPYLPYKFITTAGQPAPVPQRVSASVDTSAISMAIRQADQDLMATMGIYRAGLGDVGPEKSGRAILARQKESDQANANYGFNRNWSLLHCYRVILDMMPHIYNGPRAQRIIRPTDQNEVVMINQLFPGPDGKDQMYDIANAAGNYSVTLSVGAPASRRQQAVNTMSEILKAEPQLFTMIGDLFVDQMDADGDWKQEMVARLKKMLPPQLQDQNGNIPPQVQQQMMQLQQQHQDLVQALQKATELLKGKSMDLATKEYLGELQYQGGIIQAQIKAGSVEGMDHARQEYAKTTKLLSMHLDQMQLEQGQSHDLLMQQKDQEHAQQIQQMQQQHEQQLQQLQNQQPPAAAS